jgi:4'-phosphopantetheinyl transferase
MWGHIGGSRFNTPAQSLLVSVEQHSWPSPPAHLMLSKNDVHVWRAALDRPAEDVRRLARTLSADERTRVGQFRFERDRRRFVVGRGVLRAILGRYLGIEPGLVQFGYHPEGKPYLPQDWGAGGLRFNLAHSHGLGLYALARDREVGIDLERCSPKIDCEPIAGQFFSPREVRALQALPARERIKAFYACWTRKEAYLKARGEGLSLPLDGFDVSLAPGEPAALLDVGGDALETSRWSLRELIVDPGYAAALAVEGQGGQLACWEWRP